MIDLAAGLPAHVIIAVAHGTVAATDYENVLVPAVTAATATGAKVRLLFVLGEDFDGFEAEAALDDAELGLHHWSDFERIGLVSDHEVYRLAGRALGFLVPGQFRVFPLADQNAARDWITAG